MKRYMSPEAYQHSLEYTREYKKRNPEKVKAWARKYYLEHKAELSEYNKRRRAERGLEYERKLKNEYRSKHPDRERNRRLKQRYNLTLDELLRMQAAQNNRCAICEREGPLQVDHCHKTGRVRGLLCARCNLRLGVFETTVLEIGLEKFLKYIGQA